MADEKIANPNQLIDQHSPMSRTFLSGMRLNSRVALIIITGIFAVTAMGGVFFNAEKRLEVALNSLTASYHVANLISNAETTIFAVNNDSKNFLFTKKNVFAENYLVRSREASNILTNLLHLPEASDSQKILTNLTEGLTRHATHFQNVLRIQSLIGTDQKKGLLEKANVSGSALQRKLMETRNIKLINEIIALRQKEIVLQEVHTQEDFRNVMDAVTNIRQSVIASRLANPVKRLLNKSIAPYAADLEVLAQTRLVQVKEIAVMEEVNANLGLNLKALVTFARNLSKSARKQFGVKKIEIRNVMVGGTTLILILVTFFSTMLMRSVVRPVKSLASAAMELAGGNESVIIPAIQNQDETGEVAIALTQFRENMIQANTLRKELEYYLQDVGSPNQDNEQNYQPVETIQEPDTREIETTVELHHDTTSEVSSENVDLGAPILDQTLEENEISDEKLQSSTISEASLLVAQTSLSASNAAKDAERCDLITSGLSGALKKINDIELLLASIRDHMSLLAVQTAITNQKTPDDPDKSILQSEKASGDDQGQKVEEFIGENLDTLQNGTKRAIRAIRQVGETIKDVNEVALEIASEASNDALDATTELLQQSEDLRGMLNGLLGKIKPNTATKPNE